MGTGALLLAPRTRKLGALAAVALFIGVFPGNLNHVRMWWDKPWPARLAPLGPPAAADPDDQAAIKIYRSS